MIACGRGIEVSIHDLGHKQEAKQRGARHILQMQILQCSHVANDGGQT